MPAPIIFGLIAGGAALYGAAKGVKGAMDHSDAKDINESAQSIVNFANYNVDEQRKTTNSVLEDYGQRKLRAFNGVIADFIDTFGRLKNVDVIETPELDKLNLADFSTVSFDSLKNDYELLKNSGLGLGAGLSGGAALAFGAYNGTMLLATASTGAAISGLSGVAATNATLAWLGGGSLAAGGGGMALGSMVLGGIVAGPAIAIFGHILGNKGEEALNTAKSNMEEAKTVRDETKLLIAKLKSIEEVTSLANKTFSDISSHMRRAVHGLKTLINTDGDNYQAFSSEARETVFRSVKFAQLIKAMIDTPILDEDGNLVISTEKQIKEIKSLLG